MFCLFFSARLLLLVLPPLVALVPGFVPMFLSWNCNFVLCSISLPFINSHFKLSVSRKSSENANHLSKIDCVHL